jgi:hypothetical protein
VRGVESKNIMLWNRWPLDLGKVFLEVEGSTLGTLEGTIPNAPPINLFISFLQVGIHAFEEFGEHKHHGVEYMALGSSASRYS